MVLRLCQCYSVSQVMDPSLTSLTAVDIARRYNSCLRYNLNLGHLQQDSKSDGTTSPPSKRESDAAAVVEFECTVLEDIAKTIINNFPRAPTMNQRCCLVTLASMENLEIVRDVVNTLSGQIASATAVRASGQSRRHGASLAQS